MVTLWVVQKENISIKEILVYVRVKGVGERSFFFFKLRCTPITRLVNQTDQLPLVFASVKIDGEENYLEIKGQAALIRDRSRLDSKNYPSKDTSKFTKLNFSKKKNKYEDNFNENTTFLPNKHK